MPEVKKPEGYPETPMLDKMLEAREVLQTEAIGEFLEWCSTQGYMLGKHVLPEGYSQEQFWPLPITIEQILAEYAEIDTNAMAHEREAVLKYVQEKSG